ncbi:MAG: 4Fe-4S dicluster domain-containing protein [Chitinivibrionales bacterium]|nr:4Fe-4S dicluster domain-containing protein [Chitinivibrionales bacterium]MBD3394218.1 4Fe-4S dicluster domain-containing protein [Chitinivibrionales bacterium]
MPAFTIDQSVCTFCAGCSSVCPRQAVMIRDDCAEITDACTGCGHCFQFCPVSAVTRVEGDAP